MTMGRITLAVLLSSSGSMTLAADAPSPPAVDRPGIVSYPAPPSEALSEDYQLTVNGQPVPVYACRVSAMPFNQVWPGYQRPLDQTELAGFAYWEMVGPVRVAVKLSGKATSAVVRPASLGIPPRIDGSQISFSMERPRPLVVEVDGAHHPLHLFPSPPEINAPGPAASGVHYFA